MSPDVSTWKNLWANNEILNEYFCVVDGHVEKADLGKGYQNPKRKLGVNDAFFRDN